mmetsp:Transcript_9960/g.18970  ORF Transcript_9960/g.18970 Transcript_9960/m.18970 type:complete len:189 (-) Transcript_9960:575-1141(-)
MFEFLQALLLSFLKTLGFLHKKATIVLLGLDNAGKTTLQHRLSTGQLQQFNPTTRAQSKDVQVGGMTIKAWDVGGHAAARMLWKKYYAVADAIVFMVDATDHERIVEAKEELCKIAVVDKGYPDDVPVAIFANKIDSKLSMDAQTVAAELELEALQLRTPRPLSLFMVSCVQETGYVEGFRWLSAVIP